jgi:hypothetical protein
MTKSKEDIDFNTRSNKKTRARIRYTVIVEGPKEVINNFKSRKTRKR